MHQLDNLGKYVYLLCVTNHLEEGKKYKFRYACKCKAGFLNISMRPTMIKLLNNLLVLPMDFVENVQVWIDAEEPTDHYKGLWINVLSTKGKKILLH